MAEMWDSKGTMLRVKVQAYEESTESIQQQKTAKWGASYTKKEIRREYGTCDEEGKWVQSYGGEIWTAHLENRGTDGRIC